MERWFGLQRATIVMVRSLAPLTMILQMFPLVGMLGIGGAAEPDTRTVPVVACPEDAQTGPARSQAGQTMHVPLDQRIAAQIAYYGAADLPGVYAPRGWHCVAWNGSNGRILIATPQRLQPPYFPPPVITGPAVAIQSTSGEGIGRFHVAIVAAELFPVVGGEFVKDIRQEHLISDSSFDSQRFADDWVQYLSDRFVQYTTPANRSGLGTEGIFATSNLPVRGLAILNLESEVIALTEVHVRLPSALNSVQEAIMQLEITCVQRPGGC